MIHLRLTFTSPKIDFSPCRGAVLGKADLSTKKIKEVTCDKCKKTTLFKMAMIEHKLEGKWS